MFTTRRRSIAAAGLLTVALALTACGPDQAGSAATVGSTTISDTQLNDQAVAVMDALNLTPSAQINSVLLQRIVTGEIVNQMAAKNGVTVTEGDIDRFLEEQYKKTTGGKAALEQQLLQSGLTADQIRPAAKTSLQVEALGKKLAPGKSAADQQKAVAEAAVAFAKEQGVSINPRYGTWDPSSLSITGSGGNDLTTSIQGGGVSGLLGDNGAGNSTGQ